MPAGFFVDIEGTNFSTVGEARVASISVEAASATRNGQGTVQLIYPYGAGYSFYPTQEIQIWRSVGGASYGLLGGFIRGVSYETTKVANLANAYTIATLTCIDYNCLLDHIVANGDPSAVIHIAAGEFYDQVVDAVTAMQENGFGVVNRYLQVDSARVANLTGATVLPAFTISGESLRQVMRKLCGVAQATDTDLRPRFGIILDSDGAGGVIAAVRVWDGAVPSTSLVTFAYEPTVGQRAVRDIKRVLEGGMPILNLRQSNFNNQGSTELISYQNDASAATYFNRYLNTGNAGSTGHWTLPPADDSKSVNTPEAVAFLERMVEAVAYPRETIPVTYDSDRNTDTTFLAPGTGATLIWPPFGINSPGTLYEVSAIHVNFVSGASEMFERITATLGLPMLELFENGQDGVARAPIIGVPKLPAPTWDAPYTTGKVGGFGWVRATIAAVEGAQSYNYYYRTEVLGPDIRIGNSTALYVILNNQPPSCTRYLRAAAVNADGKEGYRSTLKTVVIKFPPGPRDSEGWDSFNAELDPTERGLEPVDTGGTFVFDDTTPYAGNSTLKLSVIPSGTVSVLLPEAHAWEEGDRKAVSVAVQSSTGAATVALVQVVYFDATDTEVGTRDDVYNGVPTPSVLTPVEYKTLAAPATVSYARILLSSQDLGLGGGVGDVWFSRPIVTPEVGIEIKDQAIVGDMINPTLTLTDQTIALTSTAKITGGGGLISMDADGIALQGNGLGTKNLDFKNEVGVKGGHISSSGSTGDFALEIAADYNGAGTTTLGVYGHDIVEVAQTAENHVIRLDSDGILYQTGNSTDKHQFDTGSVVIGGGLTDPATDGYLYIPQIDFDPTGVPNAHAGTAPICVRLSLFGPPVLWLYDAGTSTWHSLSFM